MVQPVTSVCTFENTRIPPLRVAARTRSSGTGRWRPPGTRRTSARVLWGLGRRGDQGRRLAVV